MQKNKNSDDRLNVIDVLVLLATGVFVILGLFYEPSSKIPKSASILKNEENISIVV